MTKLTNPLKHAALAITLALSSVSTLAFAENPPANAPTTAAPAKTTAAATALPSFAPLIDAVKGAVVNVDVQKRMEGEVPRALQRRLRQDDDGPINSGSGSGFIIDSHGLVLTNNHVVEGAVAIRVHLVDGRAYDARVVGRDPLTDMALIRLEGKLSDLPVVPLGDSSQMRIGDWVMAIGNPFGLSSSVSVGIISAAERQIGASRYDQFLQTDAAINPGNSGGPLFNLKGEVIGINTAIIGSATGIGFAVPSNVAKALIPQLEKTGVVSRGWLGVSIQDLTAPLARALGIAENEGALITGVNDGSPAKKAGVKDDDAVLAIDGEKVSSASALTRIIALKGPETTVTLSVVRDGKKSDVKVKLGTRPDLEGVGEIKPALSMNKGESKQTVGIAIEDVDPRMAEATGLPKSGALVVEVKPGSPAEKAGMHRGHVIIELNRQPVKTEADVKRILTAAKDKSVLLFKVASPGGGAARNYVAVDLAAP